MATPPKWPIAILYWICKRALVEEIEGDLAEDFDRRVKSRGPAYARFMFCVEALAFIRPGMIRSQFTIMNTTMIRSYITMALRSMSKKPLFTLINLFGLTVGLASVIVIAGYVMFMLSYDRQYEKAESVYRVSMRSLDEGVDQHSAMTVARVATALDKTLHSVKKVVRIYPHSALVSRDGVDKIRETRFCFTDSLFFELFPMQVLYGELSSALTKPHSVVLTRSMAMKYFGTVDVLGQEIRFEDERGTHRFNVTAVIADIPQNTHFNPDFLASMTTLDKIMPWYNGWHYPPMYVYILAADGYDPASLTTEVDLAVKRTHPDYVRPGERDYFVQPITDIHLHSNLLNEWQANSNFIYVQILTVVASLILFLACINYVNLATARGTERAREVGMRKVMGAVRRQLVGQFLGESFVTALFALILATGVAELILRMYLNDLIDKDLSIYTLFGVGHMVAALCGLVLLTIAAGIYPAFFLSRYRPASMLRGSGSAAGGAVTLQRVMVVFQFVVSCLLIVGMLIIERQTTFMREKRLGFDKDQLVAIRLFGRKAISHYQPLKDQFLAESAVRHVAVASSFPLRDGFFTWGITPEGHTAEERMTMKSLGGDQDIVKALNLELVAGRDFSHNTASDTTQAFIINEAAARSLNWKDPVGREFELIFYASGEMRRKGKVIGVVKDFHFESLYNQIDPLVIFVNTHPFYMDYMLVNLAPGNFAASMKLLEAKWKRFNPEQPFEFSIADDDLNAMYRQESKLSSMFSAFTGLSILVSCLGLFGLSAYTISRRVKEIGIRKVLGASVADLFSLLSKEYLLLIVLAQVISWPLAWWFASEWLSGFAYKIDVPMTAFFVTLGAGLVAGIASISLHIFRALRASPAETLRIE